MISNIDDLKGKYGIQEYALPGWDPGEDFVAKLRRPSLIDMTAAVGYVPNPLMGVVADLFIANRKQVDKIPRDQQSKRVFRRWPSLRWRNRPTTNLPRRGSN